MCFAAAAAAAAFFWCAAVWGRIMAYLMCKLFITWDEFVNGLK
jgi:hypothetical protein